MMGSAQAPICVIGAGPSGLATLKNLRQAGLTNVVCYEASDTIGGNWAYNEDEGHSSVYDSTFLISSKKLSQFEDYPMPDCYPDFCSHAQVLAYFQSYARHFELLPFIRFRTEVCHAQREADGGWRIRVAGPDGDSEERYSALLVCTGHHSKPFVPRYPGEFSGAMLHSHAFKTAAPFCGQRVLVVGGGNSACDVAVDVSRVAAARYASARSTSVGFARSTGPPARRVKVVMSFRPAHPSPPNGRPHRTDRVLPDPA
jgi:cation diffusion facilitator CzcD-associated flavoprotein CzcO